MKTKDLFLALLMCLSWSSDYIVTKNAVEIFPPIFFSSIRFLIVSLMILPTVRRFPPKILTLILVSFPLVVLVYGTIDIGIKLNSSVIATNIVVEFHIITSVIAAYIFLNESLTKKQIYGMIIAFFGVILVIISNTISHPLELIETLFSKNHIENYFNKNNILSLIFLTISIFSWPIYAIFSKKLTKSGVFEKEIIGWTAFFGSFFGILASFIFEKNQISSIKTANFLELSYFLYAAFFGVLLPHLILHYLIKFYDVSKVSIFSLLIPFFTTIGGILFLQEKVNMTLVFGGVLLIAGIYITQSCKTAKSDNGEDLVQPV
jgi:O-acetylserine/cysteine efflux transporter